MASTTLLQTASFQFWNVCNWPSHLIASGFKLNGMTHHFCLGVMKMLDINSPLKCWDFVITPISSSLFISASITQISPGLNFIPWGVIMLRCWAFGSKLYPVIVLKIHESDVIFDHSLTQLIKFKFWNLGIFTFSDVMELTTGIASSDVCLFTAKVVASPPSTNLGVKNALPD